MTKLKKAMWWIVGIMVFGLVAGLTGKTEENKPKVAVEAPAPVVEKVPAPKMAVGITGKAPTTIRQGEKWIVTFTVKNVGDVPIKGLRIWSGKGWDKITIASVTPNGVFEADEDEATFEIPHEIGVGVEFPVTIVAYPNDPGNHQYSFIFRERDTLKKLTGPDGEDISMGTKLAVIGR